jgi:amino acid transporter
VGWVLVLLALVNSAVANANGGTVASTRMMFAMGRIGVLPSAVGRTHPKNETPHIAVLVTTGVSIAASLIFGFWIGPFNTFIVMATILTVLVILVYMLVCASVIVYYLRDARDEFRLFKHGVFPGLAVLILVLPLYFQFHPLPPYPVSIGNWLGLAWAVIGIVLAFVLSARRPEAMAAAQEVFVAEDEAIVEAGKA